MYHSRLDEIKPYLDRGAGPPTLELAGPRERIFFDPGRHCLRYRDLRRPLPGINNVIRALVLSLHHHYGVRKIYGFRYGYEGLVKRLGHAPLELTPEVVDRIGELGARSSPLPEVPRTRRRWSTRWRS